MSETPDLAREQHDAAKSGVVVPSARKATWKTVSGAILPLLMLGAVLLSGLPLCPFHVMTGVPCPGCGLTRATIALCTGDLAGAVRWHPLVFVIAPLVALALVRTTLVSAKVIAADKWQVRVPSWIGVVFLVALLGVWIARFAGAFGGPSDPVDFAGGLIGRALHLLGLT